MRQFPGRTLDELDDMDWVRYNRALSAAAFFDADHQRQQYQAKKLKASEITAPTWKLIRRIEELVEKYGNAWNDVGHLPDS